MRPKRLSQSQRSGVRWPFAAIALMAVMLLTLTSVSLAAPIWPGGGRDAKPIDSARLAKPSAPMGASTIGNYVWADTNADGDWSTAGETEFTGGIDGVVVNLYLDANKDGVIDPGERLTENGFQTTTTGDDPNNSGTQTGWYLFDVTADGNQYIVEIDPGNFGPTGPLYGQSLTSGSNYGSNPLVVLLPDVIMNYVEADFGYAPASIDIQKTPDNQQVRVGGTATFTIRVQNTGVVALTNVQVTDPLAPDCNRTFASLAAGAVQTYTCTLTNVTADFTNVAAVTGTAPDGSSVTDNDPAPVDVINPAIDIQKTPDTQQVQPGGTATFTIQVQNTGDVTLTNVTVADPLAPNCDRTFASLAVAEVQTYTCTVVVGQNDFTNEATVTGTPPVGPNVTDTDPAPVDVIHPAIDIQKTPDTQQVQPGGTATFTIRVQNTGDVVLTNVTVTDPLATGCNRTFTSLAVGEVQTYTCIVVVGQNDFTNEATVTGTPPVGPNVTDTDPAPVDVIHPAIDIQKTPDNQQVQPGGTATFTIQVQNTGDVALTNVTVTDPLAPNCDRTFASLPVGTGQGYTCTVVVGQNDFTNIATVTGTPPAGPNVTDNDPAPVDVIHPAIDIQKTPDNQQVQPGGTATFTIRVENTGDVVLTNVQVSDPLAPDCNRTFASLAVGAVQTYTCTVTNVTADFTNVATVIGTPPVGPNVTDNDTAPVDVINPAIDIQKTPDLQQVLLGGTATFTIRVQNTGDVVLTNVTVTDPLATGCNRTFASLAVAEVQTYTCTVTNVTADFTNVAAVTGTPPVGPNVTDNDDAVVDMVFNPALRLVKTAGPSVTTQVADGDTYYIPSPGGNVYYKFVVSNTGDTNLTNVSIVDDKLGYICGPFSLPKAQSTTCYSPQVNITVDTTNTGTAVGTPAYNDFTPIPGVDPVTDDDPAIVDIWRAAYTLEKTLLTPTPARPGEEVKFRIRVTNTGDVYLGILPLIDTYNTTYLQYGFSGSYSTPWSDDNNNGGTLIWADLTAASSYGFGVDLAPQSFFDVFVEFTALADTTLLLNQETLNVARVQGAQPDLDGPTGPRQPETTPLPAQEANDGVQIIQPTGVELIGLSVGVQDGGVRLTWETVSESNIVGFNVLRSVDGGELVAVNAELIVAEYAGADSGAAYSFVDGGAAGAAYVLEVLRLDGSTTRVTF